MKLTDEMWAVMSPRLATHSRAAAEKVLATLPDALALTDEQWKRIRAVANAIGFNAYQSEADNARRREIDSLARRPAAQAQEPHISGMPAEQAEEDVVNKMLTAYDLAYKPKVGGHNHAMRAAYAVARQHFTAHPPEGLHTTEQVLEAAKWAYANSDCGECYLDQLRARLLIPASALEQQRIAAILSRHGYTWSQDDAKKIAGEIIAELADKEKSQ